MRFTVRQLEHALWILLQARDDCRDRRHYLTCASLAVSIAQVLSWERACR